MKPDLRDDEADALVERVTRALDVPEPSPLFWEHFPERVRAAVAAEPPVSVPSPAWWRRHAMGLSLASALVAAAAIWSVAPLPPEMTPATPAVPAASAAGDDAAWAMVSASAESSSVEALREAGFAVRRGGADAAIEDLTEAERAAFAAILEAEMKGEGPDGL